MLALIAGRGDLPLAVAHAQSQPPLVCAVYGTTPKGLFVDRQIRLETLGSTLQELPALGVTQVCMCGAIDRPSVDPSRLDAATLPLVPRIQKALAQGDDGALRVVISLFEEAGLHVLGVADAAPSLLAPGGILAGTAPDEKIAQLGFDALRDMGAADLGQACLVMDGRVIDQEDDRGTDALIARAPRGAVLVKGPKPNQDRRADLPTVGPNTAHSAARAGLAGVILVAGGVLMLDQAQTIASFKQAGMFLWVR